jgi:hypothetical protein
MLRTFALLLCVLSLATVACSNDDSSITGVSASYNNPSNNGSSTAGYGYVNTEVRNGDGTYVVVSDTASYIK